MVRPVGLAVIALIASTAVVASVLPARGDTGTQTPGAPSITSVTAGDRQLTVNWSASSTPADRPVVDYQVMYRAGSSGTWSMASTYSVSYDSAVQTGSDTTWAHDRDPLDLGAPTGGITSYVERTKGGRHNLDGVYRVKTDVAAVRVRVDGDASGAATIRGSYTTAPITDLRHNGTELGRVTQTATQTSFQLDAVTPPLSSGSYIWIDGWDHTSTNTKVPEFAAVTVEDRRLRIDIATVSVATSTTISGLTNQRSHQVRVRARNSAGWSAWSNVSSGTPLGTPDAPAGLWLESGDQQLIAPLDRAGQQRRLHDQRLRHPVPSRHLGRDLDRLAGEHDQHGNRHDHQHRCEQRHEVPGAGPRREQRRPTAPGQSPWPTRRASPPLRPSRSRPSAARCPPSSTTGAACCR